MACSSSQACDPRFEPRPNISDSDIECEDLTKFPSPSHHESGARQNRRRRRGVIEKRRRDRINNCLSELKRLVPAAFEKQGSQKLEKAEILQMTVDYLRCIHSRGFDSLLCDPQRFSDFQSMGFRECASEVARFFAGEGLDLQDPIRIRLMNHLQTQMSYFDNQRVATTYNCLGGTVASQSWGTIPSSPYTAPCPVTTLSPELNPVSSTSTYLNSFGSGPPTPVVRSTSIFGYPNIGEGMTANPNPLLLDNSGPNGLDPKPYRAWPSVGGEMAY